MSMLVLGYSGFTRDSRLGIGLRNPFARADQDFDSILAFREGEVPFSMFPLGYFGHDGAAALVDDGRVVACAAEERFTRVKYSLNLAGNTLLPRHAIEYCLAERGVSIRDVDVVAHYCDFTPSLVEQRIALLRPSLTAEEVAGVTRSFQEVYCRMMSGRVLLDQFEAMTGVCPRAFVPVRHHVAHAASAYYPSGFDEALILTIDGTGEVESAMLAVGRSGEIRRLRTTLLPTSLGTLYLLITVFLGFRSLGDEYKVMGLAAYGDPRPYRDVFMDLVPVDRQGCYTTPLLGGGGFRDYVLTHLGRPRGRHDPIELRHADIAASLQEALTNAVLSSLQQARAESGLRNLCMAGGVALNCSMNGAIARSGLFDRIFVQPASSDEGCSVGAALSAWAGLTDRGSEAIRRWEHVYLGPAYGTEEILAALTEHADRVTWTREPSIAAAVADALAGGEVVGWYQGKMEFGPRALGNRSILADPRRPEMKDRVNATVKYRESFRPFAPAVTLEDAGEFFEMDGLAESPFMLFAVPVRPDKRSVLPSVTHVDGSARVQTVARSVNPLFWELLQEFRKRTGVPVLLNTSFNVRNEPIVCSPGDAFQCFLSTGIDRLALGDFLVVKKKP